ncbi:hypothetical protein Tco_1239438 [Tanacetum coccineum]
MTAKGVTNYGGGFSQVTCNLIDQVNICLTWSIKLQELERILSLDTTIFTTSKDLVCKVNMMPQMCKFKDTLLMTTKFLEALTSLLFQLKLASKGIDLLSLIKKKVGNGEATSFLNDVWLGDFPLKQTYPRLYFLELDKHVSVASKLRANSLISSFRRSPRSGIEEEQLFLLISNTSSVILPNISDRWSWLLDPSGDFSVKLTREFIDDSMLPKTDVPTSSIIL